MRLLVVGPIGKQNYLAGFDIEEVAVLVSNILHCETKLLEVHPDPTPGLLVLHVPESLHYSKRHNPVGAAPKSTYRPTLPMGLTLRATELLYEHGQEPSSALRHEVGNIGHYGRDRSALAAQAENVTEQLVFLPKWCEVRDQLLSCLALGRLADVYDELSSILDALGRLGLLKTL